MAGGLATRSVNWGFGKHVYYLSREQVLQAIKYQYMAQPFAYMALVFGRVSFAVSLLMIMATNKLRRWILYGLIIGQFLINIIFVFLGLGQCSPPAKYWNRKMPGSCMSPKVIVAAGYVQGCKLDRSIQMQETLTKIVSLEYIHRFCTCAATGCDHLKSEHEVQSQSWSSSSNEFGDLVRPLSYLLRS